MSSDAMHSDEVPQRVGKKIRPSSRMEWVKEPQRTNYSGVNVSYEVPDPNAIQSHSSMWHLMMAPDFKRKPTTKNAFGVRNAEEGKPKSKALRKCIEETEMDEDESEDIPNLRKLYDVSREEMEVYHMPPANSERVLVKEERQPLLHRQSGCYAHGYRYRTITDTEEDDDDTEIEEPKKFEQFVKVPICYQYVRQSTLAAAQHQQQQQRTGAVQPFSRPEQPCRRSANKRQRCRRYQNARLLKSMAPQQIHSAPQQTLQQQQPQHLPTQSSQHHMQNQTQPLKIRTQVQNVFKQRQLELHRHRIDVEKKRLELLEVKMARERDEMSREKVLFERELELLSLKLKQMNSSTNIL